jgi:hypothetical protein
VYHILFNLNLLRLLPTIADWPGRGRAHKLGRFLGLVQLLVADTPRIHHACEVRIVGCGKWAFIAREVASRARRPVSWMVPRARESAQDRSVRGTQIPSSRRASADLRLSLHSLEILAQCMRDATPYFCSSMPLRESWLSIVAWGGVAWCHA